MPSVDQSKVGPGAATAPKVSVIVPMHNVECYLSRCLDSLVDQTLEGVEVILIDDCSIDGTFSIASDYAHGRELWHLVRNESNLGISAVRNMGVAMAQGEYVGFVDSDDWVEPTMFETLLRAVQSTESDASQIQYEVRSRFGHNPNTQAEIIRTLSGQEALGEMLREEKYGVCFYLYRKDLFPTGAEWFPVGLTCEDRIANSWLLPKARSVAVSNRVEYYYFLNLGSISYSGLDRRGLDLLEADKRVVANVERLQNLDLLKLARDRAAKGSYSLLVKWARFGVTDPLLNKDEVLPLLWDDFRMNYQTLMKSQLSLPKKIVAWQLRHCSSLLKLEFALHNALVRRR